MKKLVFASNNAHKLEEIRHILGSDFTILSLKDIGCFDDIPETTPTLEGNAEQKARWVFEKYGYNCFADDTGLIIEALNGEPGVYSARYAGEGCSYQDNVDKVLYEMQEKINRKAVFATVICLIINGKTNFFNGELVGEILEHARGKNGFGYDPIFLPEKNTLTLAEMPADIKNKLSHRYFASIKLRDFLLK